MADESMFSFSFGLKQPGRVDNTSLRTEYNPFTNSINNTLTVSVGYFEIGTFSYNIDVGKKVDFLSTLDPKDLGKLTDDFDRRLGGLKFDKFTHEKVGGLVGVSVNLQEVAGRVGVGTTDYNVYVEFAVNFSPLLNTELYEFPSFDPWGHPLHRVDEDGTPQYGPSYTSQRDKNNVPWGLDTPTERQGYQPGGGRPKEYGSLSSSPEASPSQRPGARDAAPGGYSGITDAQRSSAWGGTTANDRADAQNAASNSYSGISDNQRSSVWGGTTANDRGAPGSLSNSPEASPSQRAGARDAPSSTRSSGSISGSVGITDHQRSSVWGGTTSTPRGSPGSLARSPEASPRRFSRWSPRSGNGRLPRVRVRCFFM